ncbi:MAG: proprotein convertase P-domain-containing protein [Myxococcota bacterium]
MNVRRLLVPVFALGLSCGGGGEDPMMPGLEDDLFGLDDQDVVRMGAPSNDALPVEGKADEVLPVRLDLVATQSPVKSQGSRGVCSIFGTAAYMEHLYIVDGTLPMPDFSEQFLQWSAKIENGSFPNTSGSNSSSNLRTLRRFGTVLESDWAYESRGWSSSNDERCTGESDQPTICYTNGEPPASALAAQRWFLPSGGRWINSSARSIKSHMVNTNTAVQAGGDFYYQAWGHGASRIPRYSGYRSLGYVVTPNEADIASSNEHRAGHSFLLVGFDDELEVQAIDENGELAVDEAGEPIMQQGFFLFKNSWGTGWASDNPFGAGYGWISYEYTERFLSTYVAEVPELELEEICGDERDNDYNGQTDCSDPACASDRACIDPAGSYESAPGAAIPDNDAGGVSDTIAVADAGTLSGVSVEVEISHSYRGDLTVVLEHAGQSVTLFEREGAGADDLRQTFDVSEFDDLDAAGDWTLTVVDGASADTGVLERWALNLTTCAGGDCGSMPETLTGANDTLGVIPDADPAGVSSDITIDGSGTIATLRVAVDITHTFIGDLTISIAKDGGTPTTLLTEELIDGTMLMREFTVDALVGEAAAGTYTLTVVDGADVDEGTLNRWSVEILTE